MKTEAGARGKRQARRGAVGRALHTARGRIGVLLVAPVLVIAIFGHFVMPYDPTTFVSRPFAGISSHTWLGADYLGRDVLSRVLDGGRLLLLLAFVATVIGVVLGMTLGMVAAYIGGLVDEFIMRLLDVALAFPQLLLALLLLSVVGPKPWLICLAVAAIHTPQVARVSRAATLRVVEQDYLRFARAVGIPNRKIFASEIAPSIVGPIMVEAGLRLTYSIGIIASLGFLGLGLQPPAADWGLMINENRIGIVQNPWSVVAPVVLIAVITVGVNLFTDSIAQSVLSGADGNLLKEESDLLLVGDEAAGVPVGDSSMAPNTGAEPGEGTR